MSTSRLDLFLFSHKMATVFPRADSFYAQWRRQGGAVLLHDDRQSPPERLLQAIWQHQRLVRSKLRTVDGRPLKVLHPGFLNREGGPDFRAAVLQIGDADVVSGDIEVDIHVNGWHGHGHDRNPNFRKILLHVVWDVAAGAHDSPEEQKPGAPFPRPEATLALRSFLDATIGELSVWLSSEAGDLFPETLRGQCCAPLRELTPEKLAALFREAARIRFHSKAAQMQARAKQAGWEQALWEGLFRALGYKHNAWAMQCLAERQERWLDSGLSQFALQARLFGVSNLLPHDLTRARVTADGYVRRVWDHWWREREEFNDCILPRSLWRFHGQRPANHPQRRLALAAHWVTSGTLPDRLERWCATAIPDNQLGASLLEILQVETDDFWSWHWTISSPRLKKPQPLLGASRLTDLAVNAVLPWLWIRAAEGKNQKLQDDIFRRFELWPPAQDNAILRLARQRLLGGAGRRALRTAVEQQGLMQIVRDFCDHTNAVCEQCRFPALVRGNWADA